MIPSEFRWPSSSTIPPFPDLASPPTPYTAPTRPRRRPLTRSVITTFVKPHSTFPSILADVITCTILMVVQLVYIGRAAGAYPVLAADLKFQGIWPAWAINYTRAVYAYVIMFIVVVILVSAPPGMLGFVDRPGGEASPISMGLALAPPPPLLARVACFALAHSPTCAHTQFAAVLTIELVVVIRGYGRDLAAWRTPFPTLIAQPAQSPFSDSAAVDVDRPYKPKVSKVSADYGGREEDAGDAAYDGYGGRQVGGGYGAGLRAYDGRGGGLGGDESYPPSIHDARPVSPARQDI